MPVPQKIQPMGFSGRREATNAPTVGNANDSALKNAVKTGRVCLRSRRGEKIEQQCEGNQDHAEQPHRPGQPRSGAAAQPIDSSTLVPSVTMPLYKIIVSQTLRQP